MANLIQSLVAKYINDKEAVQVIKIVAYDYYSSFGVCKTIDDYINTCGDITEELFELYTKIGNYINEKESSVLKSISRKYLDNYSADLIRNIKRKAIVGHILNINSATRDEFYTFIERTDKDITIHEAQELYKLYSTLCDLLEQE